MLREIAEVLDGIEGWGVEFREGWMRVLAMETFLEAVDP